MPDRARHYIRTKEKVLVWTLRTSLSIYSSAEYKLSRRFAEMLGLSAYDSVSFLRSVFFSGVNKGIISVHSLEFPCT